MHFADGTEELEVVDMPATASSMAAAEDAARVKDAAAANGGSNGSSPAPAARVTDPRGMAFDPLKDKKKGGRKGPAKAAAPTGPSEAATGAAGQDGTGHGETSGTAAAAAQQGGDAVENGESETEEDDELRPQEG